MTTCAAVLLPATDFTQFVRAGGSPVPVEDVRTGDQLEDLGTPAHVEAMTPNVSYRGTQVVLTIKIYEAVAFVRITHDHRMAMQNGDYRRAHEVKVGDYLCTSDGECDVIATREVSDETPVFEIYFQEDRSVFMVCCDDVSANVAAFGSEQSVPYDPEDFVEFRFKDQICTTMGSAETWLNDTFKCKLMSSCTWFLVLFLRAPG